jgi:biopolymer transport protein ExbB
LRPSPRSIGFAKPAITPSLVSRPLPLLPSLSGLLLLLLSVAVLTLVIDRARFWIHWWRRRQARSRTWRQRIAAGADAGLLDETLADWDLAMGFGEPLLQGAALLAPLLGLIGTVTGLMGVLAQLGPRLELPPGASLATYGQVLLSTASGLVVSLVASAGLLTNQGLRSWQINQLRRERRRPVETIE